LRRAKPELVPDDQPLALVESGRHGLTITAVNARAEAEGVHAGKALVEARAVLPQLRSLPADPERDGLELLALAQWCGRYGPRRHRHGADGIWIDVSGVAHLFGGEKELLADLVRRLQGFGFSPRAALADTLGAAHALARFGAMDARRPFVIAAPGGNDEALRALPVEALRLNPETVVTLKRLGLRRIGQLYDLPRASLARRFQDLAPSRARGSKARALTTDDEGLAAVMLRLDQARGVRAEPLPALGEPAHYGVRRSWPDPLISAEALDNEVRELAVALAHKLEKAGRGWRRLRLSLYRSDGTVAEAEAGTSIASRDVPHLMRLLGERLAGIDAGFGVDVAVLEALKVGRQMEGQDALGLDRRSGAGGHADDGLARLIDRLVNCLDGARVVTLTPRDSHIPERAEERRPAFDFAQRAAAGKEPAKSQPRHGARVRPALLLDPPEPISVVAEVPDGPPARFLWRRVVHRVVRATGPERIAPEWWREIGLAEDKRSRVRDYYRVEVAGGGSCWVFRAGLYGDESATRVPAWFLHGLFG